MASVHVCNKSMDWSHHCSHIQVSQKSRLPKRNTATAQDETCYIEESLKWRKMRDLLIIEHEDIVRDTLGSFSEKLGYKPILISDPLVCNAVKSVG